MRLRRRYRHPTAPFDPKFRATPIASCRAKPSRPSTVRFGPHVQALLRFELTGSAGMEEVRIYCNPGCESRSVVPARPALAIPAGYE